MSIELVQNTGAPQGCVLSLLLFSVYINEIMCNTAVLKVIKYADDIALTACLKDEFSLSQYYQYVEMFVSWFDNSLLSSMPRKHRRCALNVGESRVHHILFLNH